MVWLGSPRQEFYFNVINLRRFVFFQTLLWSVPILYTIDVHAFQWWIDFPLVFHWWLQKPITSQTTTDLPCRSIILKIFLVLNKGSWTDSTFRSSRIYQTVLCYYIFSLTRNISHPLDICASSNTIFMVYRTAGTAIGFNATYREGT